MKEGCVLKKFIALLLTAIVLLSSCSNEKAETKSGFYMDTVCEITLYGNDSKYFDDVFEIIRKYDINFYPGCVRNEDTEFYIKYLVHEKNDIILIDYKGYFYRDNPNSAMHITNRNAFTSFQASERIEKYLTEHGLLMNYNKFLFASIQAYTVRLARERNVKLYDELHELYDVPLIMRSLIRHPRFLRSIVALVYLLLGKKVFYKMLSITGI